MAPKLNFILDTKEWLFQTKENGRMSQSNSVVSRVLALEAADPV